MPSDAFSLDEEVTVYASVTFNEYPEAMIPVAFEIHGPENPLYNITFLLMLKPTISVLLILVLE